MPLVKPTVGQTNWGPALNTALDYLDAKTADFTFTLETGEGDISYMTVHNHDMEIRTTRTSTQDADISINSADDIWVTANDSIEIASTTDEVRIYTGDFSTNWTFQSDGGFRFPDGSVQTTASGGFQLSPNTEGAITASNINDITLALNDANKFFYIVSDENNYWQQINVQPDSQVNFPVGTVVKFILVASTIIVREVYDETNDTRSNVYGQGQDGSTDYMCFSGTGIAELTKFAPNQWILTGPNIFRD